MAQIPVAEPLLLLDEIHKYSRWRALLKGIYDTEKSRRKIIVTGSARLDYYWKGGEAKCPLIRHYAIFSERTPIPRFYQVHLGEHHYESDKVIVLPFARLCNDLELP
jgi:AAA domain